MKRWPPALRGRGSQRLILKKLLLIGSGVLLRIGLGALESLRIAPVPPQMEGLVARLRDALDEQALASEALHRIRVEADEATSAAPTQAPDLGKGAFFIRDAVTNDSWLPSATVLRTEQTTLGDVGWEAIGDLASYDNRARLRRAYEGARGLRLSDVGDDFLLSSFAGASDSELRRNPSASMCSR